MGQQTPRYARPRNAAQRGGPTSPELLCSIYGPVGTAGLLYQEVLCEHTPTHARTPWNAHHGAHIMARTSWHACYVCVRACCATCAQPSHTHPQMHTPTHTHTHTHTHTVARTSWCAYHGAHIMVRTLWHARRGMRAMFVSVHAVIRVLNRPTHTMRYTHTHAPTHTHTHTSCTYTQWPLIL